MGKKMNFKTIKLFAESNGYKIITKEEDYINSRQKLKMICDNGHECEINWDNFKYGRRCKKCANLKSGSSQRLNYDYVKKYIETFNYKLLSIDYKNASTKLHIKCDNGHEFYRNYNSYKSNHVCPICKKENYKKKKSKYSKEYIIDFITSEGYKLVSGIPNNLNDKIKMICPRGHKCEIKWYNFKYGKRCKQCSIDDRADMCRHNFDDVKSYIETFEYKLNSQDYNGQDELLDMTCCDGHDFKMSFRVFKRGCRCTVCKRSQGERVVAEFLQALNINYIYNKPYFENLLSEKGNPLRPDFIIENIKVWIEYDGIFHYEKVYEGDGHENIIINDKIKNEYAKKHDWKLIRIPYWELDNINEILKRELNL